VEDVHLFRKFLKLHLIHFYFFFIIFINMLVISNGF
jgi:hypothetical protein